MTMWMIRAAEGGALFQQFVNRSTVAIGWHEVGDLEGMNTRDIIQERVREIWPEWSNRLQGKAAGSLYRFKNKISKDDHIITYDPSERIYAVGTVVEPYSFDPTFNSGEEYGLQHTRRVEWKGEVPRDALPPTAKANLTNMLAIFQLSNQSEKVILAALDGQSPEDVIETDVDDDGEILLDDKSFLEDIEEKSKAFIADQINKLDWQEVQELVAGLLRAMGYKTIVSKLGPDRGKDVIASSDGFGLGSTRIFVEVKHRQKQVSADAVRSFVGGRHENDLGLYVSTGGFSKDARYEAERARIPLALFGIDEFVDAIVENYDKMDIETRILLPLKRIYWPT